MTQELSGVTVVVFIAAGVLTMFLLFIFAKRSIMRFTLRSRRGPHVPIGHDAKKVKNDAFFLGNLGYGYFCKLSELIIIELIILTVIYFSVTQKGD